MNIRRKEKGAAIVEEAFVFSLVFLLILVFINLVFFLFGGSAASRLVLATQAEVQNTYHFEDLFDETADLDMQLESVLNSIPVNAGLTVPTELRVMVAVHDLDDGQDLTLENYNDPSYDLSGTILELSNADCASLGNNCIVYEFVDHSFVKTSGSAGIDSVCNADSSSREVVLIRIEYEYEMKLIVTGSGMTRTFTTEAINRCY